LNNCKKHAGKKEACLLIEVKNKRVSMEIKDTGTGFSFTQSEEIPSLGLRSMKERTEALGGRFILLSELGKGTMVRVEMPVTKGESK